ncbi:PTS sugar transporter subunit IIB [Holdemania massiliensis]|uniref:PTS sugar transporter subunit IIB n=1 Tax=Holdemania massiliensis TaxID=1468449 RepID=UPI001F052AD7|nr:PTS sugar transporter subunit IIB [Holdemania massiliensis]MCH1942143.1 PTS sugar transporter subunit IIB [Holdemania massiliensis]
MKNILLVCASGMSTSLLVKRMKAAAQEQGFECTIEAVGNAYVKEKRGMIDILMVGPQLRFSYDALVKEFPDIPVVLIDMLSYGKVDGKKVLEEAKKVMGVQ